MEQINYSTHEQHPWTAPMNSTHEQHPWTAPMNSTHEQHPWTAPMNNTHGQHPWTTNYSTHEQHPWTTNYSTHEQHPWTAPMNSTHEQHPWTAPMNSTHEQHPWTTNFHHENINLWCGAHYWENNGQNDRFETLQVRQNIRTLFLVPWLLGVFRLWSTRWTLGASGLRLPNKLDPLVEAQDSEWYLVTNTFIR